MHHHHLKPSTKKNCPPGPFLLCSPEIWKENKSEEPEPLYLVQTSKESCNNGSQTLKLYAYLDANVLVAVQGALNVGKYNILGMSIRMIFWLPTFWLRTPKTPVKRAISSDTSHEKYAKTPNTSGGAFCYTSGKTWTSWWFQPMRKNEIVMKLYHFRMKLR